MKLLLLILLTTIAASAAVTRGYRTDRVLREPIRDRRSNLDYDDIETADQEQVEGFNDQPERSRDDTSRKSSRVGVYSSVNSIPTGSVKTKPRRLSKAGSVKDSEASGTHFDGTNFGSVGHFHGPEVSQIHHEILNPGLLPLYHPSSAGANGGNILLHTSTAAGIGLDAGQHHHHPILVHGGNGGLAAPGFITNPGQGAVPQSPENELGEDITKPVYVFSAPPHPHPFDYGHRAAIPKFQLPQRLQKVLYISPHSPHQPPQELPPPPDLKTLLYVLVKKPQSHQLPINFIKSQLAPHLHPYHKPEQAIIRIRYNNRLFGLSPSAVGPIEENLPVTHSGVQFTPITPQEEIRGNIDYGPAIQAQYEDNSPHSPYDLEGYQDDGHISASQVFSQRGSNRIK